MSETGKGRRTKGTPQGGVISPLLANPFLHHALDDWLRRRYPQVQFERYADDAVIHCASEVQAKEVLEAVRGRLRECGLELHPEKTRIVHCKDDNRREDRAHTKFDFLGYTFQARRAENRWGRFFVSFLPAITSKGGRSTARTTLHERTTRPSGPRGFPSEAAPPAVQPPAELT